MLKPFHSKSDSLTPVNSMEQLKATIRESNGQVAGERWIEVDYDGAVVGEEADMGIFTLLRSTDSDDDDLLLFLPDRMSDHEDFFYPEIITDEMVLHGAIKLAGTTQ